MLKLEYFKEVAVQRLPGIFGLGIIGWESCWRILGPTLTAGAPASLCLHLYTQ